MALYIHDSNDEKHTELTASELTRYLEFDRQYNFPTSGYWRYIANGNHAGGI